VTSYKSAANSKIGYGSTEVENLTLNPMIKGSYYATGFGKKKMAKQNSTTNAALS
jgi:hypothetical protein